MDINVKVTIGAEPELITHLACLSECVKDVLMVSNSHLAAAEPVKTEQVKAEQAKTEPAKKKSKPAEKKTDPVKEDHDTLKAAPEPVKAEEKAPEPVKAEEKAPEPAKEEEAPAISEADLRKFCVKFVKKDPANKAKVVAAFKSVGATKLPEVKPKDYRKVMDQLK